MTRRELMWILLGSPGAGMLDVERLLWRPKAMITVPADPNLVRRVLTEARDESGFTGFPPGGARGRIHGQILFLGNIGGPYAPTPRQRRMIVGIEEPTS